MGPPRPAPLSKRPFSRESLRQILPAPQGELADCPTCSRIAPFVGRSVKGGDVEYDTRPMDALAELRFFLRLGQHVERNWLEVCPHCRRLYYVESGYEYLVNGSEDIDSHTRITPEEVLDLAEVSWADHEGSELFEGPADTWAINRYETPR